MRTTWGADWRRAATCCRLGRSGGSHTAGPNPSLCLLGPAPVAGIGPMWWVELVPGDRTPSGPALPGRLWVWGRHCGQDWLPFSPNLKAQRLCDMGPWLPLSRRPRLVASLGNPSWPCGRLGVAWAGAHPPSRWVLLGTGPQCIARADPGPQAGGGRLAARSAAFDLGAPAAGWWWSVPRPPRASCH